MLPPEPSVLEQPLPAWEDVINRQIVIRQGCASALLGGVEDEWPAVVARVLLMPELAQPDEERVFVSIQGMQA